MLKRLALALVFALSAIGAAVQPAAAEGSGGAHLEDFGTIVIEVQIPGSSGGGGRGQGSAGGGGSAPSGCFTGSGSELPCIQWGLAWRPDLQCYARVKPYQPPLTDPVWEGNTTGTIIECRTGTEGGWSNTWDLWAAAAQLAAPPDPAELARRAVERMQLEAIRMGTFPEQAERAPRDLGYVGWNSWMWVSNPTPANWWLDDRDGEWTIGVQGGYQAEGMENMPESLFGPGWIAVNGDYGYRCACLKVDTDRKTSRIRQIHAARPLPMRKCEADKALKKAVKNARMP